MVQLASNVALLCGLRLLSGPLIGGHPSSLAKSRYGLLKADPPCLHYEVEHIARFTASKALEAAPVLIILDAYS